MDGQPLRKYWETVEIWLRAAGFQRVERTPVEHIIDHKAGRDVLEDPFLQKDSTSQLILLSQAEYTVGIERIHKALLSAEQAGHNLLFPVYLHLDMPTARAAG